MASIAKRVSNFNDGIDATRLEKEMNNIYKILNRDVLPQVNKVTKSPVVTLANLYQPNDGNPKNNLALVNAVVYNSQAFFGGKNDWIIKDFDYTQGDGVARALTTMNVGDLLAWLIVVVDPLKSGATFSGVSNFQVVDSQQYLIKNEEINLGAVEQNVYPIFEYFSNSDIVQYTLTGTVTQGQAKIIAIILRSLLTR